MIHVAKQHHRKVFLQQSLRAWQQAASASKEEAAAQARKQHTWAKVQGWLAEGTANSGSSTMTGQATGTTHWQVRVLCIVPACAVALLRSTLLCCFMVNVQSRSGKFTWNFLLRFRRSIRHAVVMRSFAS